MKNRLISIIIPCYNVGEYVERCLRSLEMQSIGMNNLEIICVDDKSTDDTLDILHQWEQRFPENICIVELDSNGRQGRARNIGLQYATCDWIAYIDSDDWIEPDYCKILYDGIEFCNSIPDMVCCKMRRDASNELSFFGGSEDGLADHNERKTYRTRDLSIENDRREASVLATLSFSAYCKLIRKEFLLANRLFFPERLAYEDIYWGSLLPYYAGLVCFTDVELYHYYVNPTSTVLVNNALYHPDMLTVNMKLWDAYTERSLYTTYKDEIEYNFLYTCYLAFLKVLALRYSEPHYSLFLLLQEITRERIPAWRNNRYIHNGDIKEFHMLLLELIDKDVNREEFIQILDVIRQSGM